jgi:hypothetical protein
MNQYSYQPKLDPARLQWLVRLLGPKRAYINLATDAPASFNQRLQFVRNSGENRFAVNTSNMIL